MNLIRSLALASFCLLVLPPLAQAQQDFISLGLGVYDILDEDEAADFRAEYRSGESLLIQDLHPWAGVEVTSDTSIWAGGGILLDYEFNPQWHVIPNFGVGLYTEGDSNKDLDFPIEFRSQLEVAYEYDNGQRAGVAFGHISNASLGDHNPGTEILNLYWHIPY
ncbi:MAG: acyloxyacyl hydrolase [Alphaproteobacteria bacterium]|nr:acyloxyacyl hydrolase [Alphaproteobacteria bacterium]